MTFWRDVRRAAVLLALFPAAAAAQPPPPPEGPRPGAFVPGVRVGPPFEEQVAGRPYTAETLLERASHAEGAEPLRVTGISARDGAGRTRHDGLAGPPGREHPVVAISDPVADVLLLLDPARATARRHPATWNLRLPAPREGGPAGRPHPQGPGPEREALGTEVIAGYATEGTRDTFRHQGPDGASVEVVIERWHSPELATDLRSTHRGPGGEWTRTVTAVTLGEPDAALFAVPAGYAVQDAPRRAPAPPR